MSDAEEFLMTYPVFIPQRPDDIPFTATDEDGHVCVLLFTDDDMAGRFFESAQLEHGGKCGEFANSAELCAYLRAWNGRQSPSGAISGVGIDLSAGVSLGRLRSIVGLVEHLESLPPETGSAT